MGASATSSRRPFPWWWREVKRAFNLMDRVRSPEALLAAFYRARRGKRYRLEADSFFANLEKEVFALSRALSDGSYAPGEYRHFYVKEPKLRLVSAARSKATVFRDRVVHHAIYAVLGPIFEKRFVFDTYCGKVVQTAVSAEGVGGPGGSGVGLGELRSRWKA